MTSNPGLFGVGLPTNSQLRHPLVLDNAYYRAPAEAALPWLWDANNL